jgi:hypothetical protein
VRAIRSARSMPFSMRSSRSSVSTRSPRIFGCLARNSARTGIRRAAPTDAGAVICSVGFGLS